MPLPPLSTDSRSCRDGFYHCHFVSDQSWRHSVDLYVLATDLLLFDSLRELMLHLAIKARVQVLNS